MHIICRSYLYIIINKFIFKEWIFIISVLTNSVFYNQCMFELSKTDMLVHLIIYVFR